MKITMYHRTYPVKNAPVAMSFVPFSPDQIHTFTVGTKVYPAVRKEVQVIVPDDAKVDKDKNLLIWVTDQGPLKSTANEIFGLAETGVSGFKTVPG